MPPDPNAPNQQPSTNGKPFVNTFALIVTWLSAGILVILLLMAFFYMCCKDCPAFENIKTLFNILLPVIGTWMGTMLAFYFSKENFKAANEQAANLANSMNNDNASVQASVTDIMIKPNDSILLLLKDMDEFKGKTLSELIQKMEETNSDRLPILEKDTLKFIFLIYRTTIERFIVAVAKGEVKIKGAAVASDAIPGLKMQDMFDSDFKLFKDIENYKACFLPVGATMDKVKEAMQNNAICQDVFITATGKSDEKVEGWITNLMVIEKAALFKKAGSN